MTKIELAILLFSHSGEITQMGSGAITMYGCLTEEGYGEAYGSSIEEYITFSTEQANLIEKIATDDKTREKWSSGELDSLIPDDDYDAIDTGLEIYSEFNEILEDNAYYNFLDDSEDVFESYEDAEETMHRLIRENAELQNVTPYLKYSKEELETLCEAFLIDYKEINQVKDKEWIIEELEAQQE